MNLRFPIRASPRLLPWRQAHRPWGLEYRRKTNVATQVEKTYENAIRIITSRRRPIRPGNSTPGAATLDRLPKDSGTPDLRGTPSILGMTEWLQMLGHSENAINALNIVHVAGTKGKGSTCAFTESFLRAHGQRTGYPRKTGMYTSPHLLVPEERIRIDSKPLEPAALAEYLFEVEDKLPQLALPYDSGKSVVDRGPRLLQLYALLAFHVFIREAVDVAVIETHSGGEYDATNVVKAPLVTAVTALGMDHVQMLGPTIENIAWHKAGIFKSGAVALSTVQGAASAGVLMERARQVGADLRFVDKNAQLPEHASQLKPEVQKMNLSLAIEATNAWLERKAPPDCRVLTAQDIELGVQQWTWPGRFQIIPDGGRTWFLDSAHNDMSVRIAAEWFVEICKEMNEPAVKILIFSHINELRDAESVLKSLATTMRESRVHVEHAIFTTSTESDAASQCTGDQELFRTTWRSYHPDSKLWYESSIRAAIDRAKMLAGQSSIHGAQVLVTGSQALVGPAIGIL